MSVAVAKARWSLFGKVLRFDRKAPAQAAMDLYVAPPGTAGKGRPTTCLPIILHDELKSFLPDVLDKRGITLRSTAGSLHQLREMANHCEESESGLQVYHTWDYLVDRVVCNASNNEIRSEDDKKVSYQKTQPKQAPTSSA